MTKNNLISMVDFPNVTKNVKEKEGKKKIKKYKVGTIRTYKFLRRSALTYW